MGSAVSFEAIEQQIRDHIIHRPDKKLLKDAFGGRVQSEAEVVKRLAKFVFKHTKTFSKHRLPDSSKLLQIRRGDILEFAKKLGKYPIGWRGKLVDGIFRLSTIFVYGENADPPAPDRAALDYLKNREQQQRRQRSPDSSSSSQDSSSSSPSDNDEPPPTAAAAVVGGHSENSRALTSATSSMAAALGPAADVQVLDLRTIPDVDEVIGGGCRSPYWKLADTSVDLGMQALLRASLNYDDVEGEYPIEVVACGGPAWFLLLGLSGRTLKLRVERGMTMSKLKGLVQQRFGIPISQQRLFCNGDVVSSDRQLISAGMEASRDKYCPLTTARNAPEASAPVASLAERIASRVADATAGFASGITAALPGMRSDPFMDRAERAPTPPTTHYFVQQEVRPIVPVREATPPRTHYIRQREASPFVARHPAATMSASATGVFGGFTPFSRGDSSGVTMRFAGG